MSQLQSPTLDLEVRAPVAAPHSDILSADALRFVERLVREFGPQREELLRRRAKRQREFDAGQRPDFLPETEHIRQADWTVAPIPRDLQDRRVEITGPTDRKMIINALNSGASVYMADFEDANRPTWHNLIDGQRNLCDAVDGTISFTSPEGKQYRLNETDGHAHGAAARAAPAGKARAGWTASRCRARCSTSACSSSTTPESCWIRGSGPYFYLPKLESHLEARLWNDVFLMAQDELGIPRGSIRATVLIETIPAAFEMDEILYELREHSAGLNCGRWDYIFSIIKKFRKHPAVHHARPGAGHHDHALHALVFAAGDQDLPSPGHSRHRRHGRADPHQERSRRRTKRRWRRSGPTRCARRATATTARGWPIPGLVPIAKAAFDARMPQPNQIDRRRDDVQVTAEDLLTVPAGRDHRARAVPEHRRGHPIHGRLAGRQRLRAPLQPDGRRRHGRNLPRPDLAVGPPAQRRPCPTAGRSRPNWSARSSRNRWTNCSKRSGRNVSPAAITSRPGN